MAMVEWEVLNPEAEYEKPVGVLADRLPDLNNKKIGLFWNAKRDGNVLLDAVGGLLQERFKNIQLIKFDLWISAGAENIRRMAEESDAVIAAIGD